MGAVNCDEEESEKYDPRDDLLGERLVCLDYLHAECYDSLLHHTHLHGETCEKNIASLLRCHFH